jgi:putative ABC transport system ATP-binding protein
MMGDCIYVVAEGKMELIRVLADGRDEVVKVAPARHYFGEMGPLFSLPRSATARACTDTTVIGYTVQQFRERLGSIGVRDIIEHKELDD